MSMFKTVRTGGSVVCVTPYRIDGVTSVESDSSGRQLFFLPKTSLTTTIFNLSSVMTSVIRETYGHTVTPQEKERVDVRNIGLEEAE